MQETQNLRVRETTRLVSPSDLIASLPMTKISNAVVVQGRDAIERILRKDDDRLLVIVGPCSIHDVAGALDYAKRLATLRDAVKDSMCIVMRVYFEKPRTTIGWKGMINDPHLDESFDMAFGLRTARQLLLDITAMGLPVATEFLDPITPHYVSDLVSWAAVGARTTESQTHREMASGLSMPVGFKNSTDGSLQVAIDAMHAARHPHSFLGIDQDGLTSIVTTTGNPTGHVVLRGGRLRPNYDPASIAEAAASLKQANLLPVLIVDCSHANSHKQHDEQEAVLESVIQQRAAGNDAIIGVMLESYLEAGNQPIPKNPNELKYGVSITDACISWQTTERLLKESFNVLKKPHMKGQSLSSVG
jgi:3-deoxy-7-phosphoheptulonate synthase